jgi:hypothetical protein
LNSKYDYLPFADPFSFCEEKKSGPAQAKDSFPLVGYFSPVWAKNNLHKEEKYLAAAG